MIKKESTNYENKTELIEECPLMFALSKIGSRWKPYIIWKLGKTTLRFKEIHRLIPAITERMLILSLKELEGAGLIERKSYQQVPPKVEYSLTPTAIDLLPVLKQLYIWGEHIHKASNANNKPAKSLK
ncbi:MAG: helix-turn-helix domain-containing protein [Ferruginibacter sp.]